MQEVHLTTSAEAPYLGQVFYRQFAKDASFEAMCDWEMKTGTASSYSIPGDDTFGGTPDEGLAKIQTGYALLEAVHYIIAIRVLEYVKPDAEHRRSGLVRGDARVLDDTGAAHGGFRFAAQNSEKIQVMTSTSANGKEESDNSWASANTDLNDNARKAFSAALAKAVPGSSITISDR